jgi:superfamily I DNA and/or RNA helicase
MPPEASLLLATTYRMHPAVCGFVFAAFYAKCLQAAASCNDQRLDNPENLSPSGVGLRWVPVTQTGRTGYSPEEVQAVRHLVKHVISSRWTAQDGTVRRVGPQDILVMSPSNVQVAEIQQTVSIDVAVGTVDKF